MSDLDKYIDKRIKNDPEFSYNFEEGYEEFKLGLMIKEMRHEYGLTQEDLAKKIKTTKSAISRIENHSEDMKISTLVKIAKSLGKKLKIEIV